jgi:hypothetical protein
MSEFLSFGEFSQTELISLNITEMHKKVIHKADVVLSNGKTIKPEILSNLPGKSDFQTFLTEIPTLADLCLWRIAIHKINSDFNVLTARIYQSPT